MKQPTHDEHEHNKFAKVKEEIWTEAFEQGHLSERERILKIIKKYQSWDDVTIEDIIEELGLEIEK